MDQYDILEKDIYHNNIVSININGNVLTIVENGVETLLLISTIIALEFFPKERKIVIDLDNPGFTSYTIPNNPDLEKQYENIKTNWLHHYNPAYDIQ